MSIASDLAAMTTGWGSSAVTLGNFSGRCLLSEGDVVEVDHSGDPVLVRKSFLTFRRSDFVTALGVLTVARGDTATVDDVVYTVSDVRVAGADGQALLVFVRKT